VVGLPLLREKRALYKNVGSAIVRGNKTDNRPNPNSQPNEFLLLSVECLKTLNADILLRNRRIFKKDYKRILFINVVFYTKFRRILWIFLMLFRKGLINADREIVK